MSEEIAFETPATVLVADASKVTRRLISKVIGEALPSATVHGCATAAEALAFCQSQDVDLVTSALRLPDMDGVELCRKIRELKTQKYIPLILVSGDVQERMVNRELGDVTDYFDKSHGFAALGDFVRGYLTPGGQISGRVLYVEDSRVVALATRRMLEASGIEVDHVVSVEDALEKIAAALDEQGQPGYDLVLTDVYLKGGLTGMELVEKVRSEMGLGRGLLPVVVMTGDDNQANQSTLLKAGANDLVVKPIDEQILINKLRFQLQLAAGAA